uniref:Serine/threonine/tyrosine interacting-like 1 n=1 Tax=Scleropages formosus TaxID=113540 RepID=A0A8C9TE72_SCLFO
MSQIILCDATELYNILNQYFRVSRLVEFNYLCLIDARSQEEYNESHIITARKELESMKPYPVEILPGQLYMGDYRQATSPQIHKDLKLQAVVNVSEKTNHFGICEYLDLLSIPNCNYRFCYDSVVIIFRILSCETFHVSGSHFSAGSAILIFSSDGISRCSTVSIAFLQYHLKFTLQEAWEHMLKCKSNMRPKRGFVQQLSDWEVHTLGERKTFIAEPHY